MGKSFLTILGITLLWWVSAVCAGSKCEVVNFTPYEKLSGSGSTDYYSVNMDITKTQCASVTIRNTTSGSMYVKDYDLIVSFADGRTSRMPISLSDMSNVSGRSFTVNKCFGISDAPIVQLVCD